MASTSFGHPVPSFSRRFGPAASYYQHKDGRYFVINPQRGAVFVKPEESRALRHALSSSLRVRYGLKTCC